MLLTSKTIVFLGFGFVLGFFLNGVFHYQDQATMEKICKNKEPIYELYKKCMKRQQQRCPKETEVKAAPAFKNIKMPSDEPAVSKNKEIASELEHVVKPPRDATKRYKLLSHELATRKLVLVGVVTAQKYLDTRATAVYNTWGKQMADIIFFSEQPNSTQHVNFPVVTLEGVDDLTYPPQRKVFKMLQYMYKKYINQFDFFMRVDDDMYVKKEQLYDLLLATNPAQDIYMGSPGFGKPEDRKRLKLEEHEHYCMGGPGVVFSRALLRKLGPQVDDCLKNVVVSYNEDVEVGRCISRKLQVQCTWAYQTRELFFMDYSKELVTEQLYEMESVKSAVTLHPLKSPIHMYRVHQYILELSAVQLQQTAIKNAYEIQETNERIPLKFQRYKAESWLGHFVKFRPASRFEVLTWYYFNSTRLCSDAEGKQAVTLPTDLKYSVNAVVLQALINHLNHFGPKGHHYAPPYHLYDGFVLNDFSRGVEYVLRLSVHFDGNSDPYRLVANVFLPFNSAPLVQYRPWLAVTTSTTMSMLVHIDQYTDHSHFLSLFEKICLQRNLRVSLHVALTAFDGSDKIIEELSSLRSQYPTAEITYKLTSQTARGHALHQIVPEDKEQLLLFFDPNYILTETFIDHCLMNTIANKQVFFPVIFSLYNSDIADKLNIPRKSIVSAETGFWNKYNYRVVCIYQSDYQNVGGFDTTLQSGEDVALFEKIRNSPLQIFRALEPYLVRPFMQRSCDELPEAQQVTCLNAVMDTVGSRRQLGLLVLQHKLV